MYLFNRKMREIFHLILNHQFEEFDDQHLIDNIDTNLFCYCNAEIDCQTIKMFAIKKIINSIISD